MNPDRDIPLHATIGQWAPLPQKPLQIVDCSRYRDGGAQGGSGSLVISDATGQKYYFFFDKFLGRLCHGKKFAKGDDAAFIESGSQLEESLFAFLETQLEHPKFGEELRKRLAIARVYKNNANKTIDATPES